VSTVDQHAEAHRLKTECRYGERRIAAELGVSRHVVRQLLARPLPEPVVDQDDPVVEPVPWTADQTAPVVDQEPPVVEPVASLVDQRQPAANQGRLVVEPVVDLVDLPGPVVEGLVEAPASVGHVTGLVRFVLPGTRGPWLLVDLAGRPRLWRAVTRLVRLGLRIPYVVDVAVRSFAGAYYQAVTSGDLVPGEPYEIRTVVRPRQRQTA
jgi:hypothetical protein